MTHSNDPSKPCVKENFEDFFESALCGYIVSDMAGSIQLANKKIAGWVECNATELQGKKFSDLLSIPAKIYYETSLAPLLKIQGFFDEVLLEITTASGGRMKVMVNAIESKVEEAGFANIRYTIFKSGDRLRYEQSLKEAKSVAEQELLTQTELVALREQLIAVLGHDLRNPMTAIKMAVQLLEPRLTDKNSELVAIIKRSSVRATDLVNNIMDFARARLGDEMILSRKETIMEPILLQVAAELILAHPAREIITEVQLPLPVNCDPARVAQLVSNLLANALTHGDRNKPVKLLASQLNGRTTVEIINNGKPIPANLHAGLFSPFTRDTTREHQPGLGLGLYICAEIARAHGALLTFRSDEKETCFRFEME